MLASGAASPFLLTELDVEVEEDVPCAPDNRLGDVVYVTLDRTVVTNPNDVLLRSSLNNGVLPTLVIPGQFPRRDDDGNWQVALNVDVRALNDDEQINVQSTRFVYVNVTPVEDTTLVPVYPGTTQMIEQARPVQTLDNGDLRYWFFSYTLVDPAFYDEFVDLVQGEFYKLNLNIEFRSFTETAVTGRITETCFSDDSSEQRQRRAPGSSRRTRSMPSWASSSWSS